MGRNARALVMEDRERWRTLLIETLQQGGFVVDSAASVAEARRQLDTGFYHLVVLDINMNESDPTNDQGMGMLTFLRERDYAEALKVVMLSGYGTKERILKAFRDFKVDDFIEKEEFDNEQFLARTQELVLDRNEINLNLEIRTPGVAERHSLLVDVEFDDVRIERGMTSLAERALAELEDLLCRLFHAAETLRVQHVANGHSGTGVLRVMPFYERGGGNEVIVKFGSVAKIQQERHNFEQYAKPFIGAGRNSTTLDVQRSARLGGITYTLVGASAGQPEDFGSFYRRSTVPAITAFLDQLFLGTCAQWYRNLGVQRLVDLNEEYQRTKRLSPERLRRALDELFPDVERGARLRFHDLGDERTFADPVAALEGNPPFEISTYTPITHGDLNHRNILVDANGNAWLIDFQRTGPGHVLRDIALLDTVLRIELLAPSEASLADRLRLEDTLCGIGSYRAFEHDAPGLGDANPAIAKALQVSAYLRLLVRRLLPYHSDDDIREYWIASLYQSVNMIRFGWLHKVQRDHALLAAGILADRLGL
jgi:CheY-like chemotaxis protein